MEPWQLELAYYLARHFWAVACGGFGLALLWARTTFRLWTRTRYLGEVLGRFERVSASRETALIERATDRLLKAFFKAPKPTLESLANDTETPWNVEPSTGSFPKRDR